MTVVSGKFLKPRPWTLDPTTTTRIHTFEVEILLAHRASNNPKPQTLNPKPGKWAGDFASRLQQP